MATIQHLPYLGSAEEDVLFVDWLVAPGDAVHRGDVLATVETLKAAFDVEAEHTGTILRTLVAGGDRVAVRAPIAIVGEAEEELDEAALQQLLATTATTATPDAGDAAPTPPPIPTPTTAPEPFTPGPPQGRRAPVAPAARRRAQELGVDPESLVGTGSGGLVRIEDVEAAARAGSAATGELDPAFVALLRTDAAAFAALSSDFKVALYRKHGAVLGQGCRFGPGAIVRAERLVVGDGAFFGPDCSVDVRDFQAGALLHLGARNKVRCTRARFGDNAFFAEDVEVGGGGAMDPEAELVVGSHGFVGEHVHLNPCRRLSIGDEVVVSRQVVVMTHSFGQSALAGYPNRFAPVHIGDRAQLGIGAVLFPGTEVGDGAILLSGSSLVSAVPAGRLFGGVPATDLKAAAAPLGPEAFRQQARQLLDEFARQLTLRGLPITSAEVGDGVEYALVRLGRTHLLRWSPAAQFDAPPAGLAEEIRVAVAFGDEAFAAMPRAIVAIDLSAVKIRGAQGPLADALREFLRKRGVRLSPRTWTYPGGLL